MKRAPVTSSSIVSAGYDVGSQTLEIEFVAGAVYRYFDVPPGVLDRLLAAESPGRFVNAQVRGHYRYARM